jgi:hypothetical protein
MPSKAVKSLSRLLPPEGPLYEKFKASAEVHMGQEEWEELRDCEQRSELWLKKRKIKAKVGKFEALVARFTGSITGKLLGVGCESTSRALYSMTHGSTFTGNPATRWGTEKEQKAEGSFQAYLESRIGQAYPGLAGSVIEAVELLNYGLVVDREEPKFAYSPDGVVHWTVRQAAVPAAPSAPEIIHLYQLDEYKCPYGARGWTEFKTDDPYKTMRMPLLDHLLELPTKPYYYSQVQWGMYLMHRTGVINCRDNAHFVVWFPAYPQQPDCPVRVEPSGPQKQFKSVQTSQGSFQYCLVPYNQKYVDHMLELFRAQWDSILIPELWRVAQINAHVKESMTAIPRHLTRETLYEKNGTVPFHLAVPRKSSEGESLPFFACQPKKKTTQSKPQRKHVQPDALVV